MKSSSSRNLLLATLKLFSPQISRKWNGVLVPNNMCPLCILPRFMSGGGLELPRSPCAGNWVWFTQLGGSRSYTYKATPCTVRSQSLPRRFPLLFSFVRIINDVLVGETQDHYGMLLGECKWPRHICGDCWVKRRKEALHPEGSKECPLSASSVSKN